MNFFEKLKTIRKANNLTQEELAEKLGTSRQAVTKWERGEGLPDITNLKQISKLFNITIDELLKDDLDIEIKTNKNGFTKEIEIDHSKHFDIKINKTYALSIKPCIEEKIIIGFESNECDSLEEHLKIKLDDLYNRMDIDIKCKKTINDLVINLYIPEKYINEIELKSKIKSLTVENLSFHKLEYDGDLKYVNIFNSNGKLVLNTTKSDVEVFYDIFDGALEVNTINSISRVSIPKDAKYKTILKGRKCEFVDAVNSEDAKNVIELNGIGSKLIILEK